MKLPSFPFDLRTILIGELALALASAGLAVLLPASLRGLAISSACMSAMAFITHIVLVPMKGFDYVIYNEKPDSPYKYYWFFSIFIFVYVGKTLSDAILY